MPNVLKKFLFSRKFWAFIGGLVAVLAAAAQDGFFSTEEIKQVVWLVVGYIFSVAFEDGLSHHNAGQTTVSTPSDNVTVTTESKG
jgi:hypothetical protein